MATANPGLGSFPAKPTILASAGATLYRDRAVGSNSAVSSYAQAITACLTSEPSNLIERGIFQNVLVFPFGLGSATQTFSLRVIRWYHKKGTSNSLFVPVIAFEGVCTMGAPVGVAANELLLNTEGLCYSIVPDATLTEAAPAVYTRSPGTTGHVGYILVDLMGAQFFSFDYGGSGSVTSANVLYGLV